MASGILVGDDLWINPDQVAQCEYYPALHGKNASCVVQFKSGGPRRVLEGVDAVRFWAQLRVYHTANASVHDRKTFLLDPDPLDKIRSPKYTENPETLNR